MAPSISTNSWRAVSSGSGSAAACASISTWASSRALCRRDTSRMGFAGSPISPAALMNAQPRNPSDANHSRKASKMDSRRARGVAACGVAVMNHCIQRASRACKAAATSASLVG
ncbi:hypothetical protein G6F31_020927 [Rhizopus arrhizus]|nr:hypothetical protein G6F31_020927 [Rhizopus arrhizus]